MNTLQHISPVAELALLAWIPAAMLLFMILPTRIAVVSVFVAGWLLLPTGTMPIAGLPDFGKMEATCLGALLGVLLFDLPTLTRFRPGWVDLPLALWCLVPMATSLSNDLGWYDGLSGVYGKCLAWAIPIVLGRVYLADRSGLLLFAKAMIVGALLYIPLCWIEIRLSPQLHHWIYGYHQHSFIQQMRYGGFRPMVFLPHGIAVSVYLAISASLLLWLWGGGAIRKIAGIPAPLALAGLLITLIGCKTVSGLALFGLAAGCFLLGKTISLRLLLLGLLLTTPMYAAVRLTGTLPTKTIVDLAVKVSAERAQSLELRLVEEDLFGRHTMTRPTFGWGGWNRNWPLDDQGQRIRIPIDAFWMIVFSANGFVGLSTFLATMLIGPTLVCARFSSRTLLSQQFLPLTALTLMVCLCLIENLFNGLPNPLVYIAIGGILGGATSPIHKPAGPIPAHQDAPRPAVFRRQSTGEPSTSAEPTVSGD